MTTTQSQPSPRYSVLVHMGGKNYEYNFGKAEHDAAVECAIYFRKYNNTTVTLIDNDTGETS